MYKVYGNLKREFELPGPVDGAGDSTVSAHVSASRAIPVKAAGGCTSGKGSAKDKIPRIAEGKYLKLLYDLHDKRGTLKRGQDGTGTHDVPGLRCVKADTVEKLTVYFLKGVFHR